MIVSKCPKERSELFPQAERHCPSSVSRRSLPWVDMPGRPHPQGRPDLAPHPWTLIPSLIEAETSSGGTDVLSTYIGGVFHWVSGGGGGGRNVTPAWTPSDANERTGL